MKEDNKSAGLTPEGYKERFISLLKDLDTKFDIKQKNLSDYLVAKGLPYDQVAISKLKKGEGSDFHYDAIFEQVDHLKKELEPFYPSKLKEGFEVILAREKDARMAMRKDEGITDHQEEESDLPEEENRGQLSVTEKQLDFTAHKQNRSKQEPQLMSRLFKILVGILFLWLFSLSAFLFFQWQNRPAEQKTILLSPQGGENSPWVDTGIEVAPGDEIKIEASGKINLAFHRMVEAAINDTPPLHAWTGPKGELEEEIVNRLRKKYNAEELERLKLDNALSEEQEKALADFKKNKSKVLDRNKRIGKKVSNRWGEIIWCVAPTEPTDIPMSIPNIRSYSESVDGASNTAKFIKYNYPQKGKIFITVNDVWLYNHKDYLDESQYATLQLADSEKLSAEKIKELKKWEYYNPWFDDNAGAFLVTVTKK